MHCATNARHYDKSPRFHWALLSPCLSFFLFLAFSYSIVVQNEWIGAQRGQSEACTSTTSYGAIFAAVANIQVHGTPTAYTTVASARAPVVPNRLDFYWTTIQSDWPWLRLRSVELNTEWASRRFEIMPEHRTCTHSRHTIVSSRNVA